MYERLLDKKSQPSFNEFIEYCGEVKELFEELNNYMLDELKVESLMRFPYGNSYGWSMKYFIKSKIICDVFAEKDAFTVMIRLTNLQFQKEYDDITEYTKQYIDNKYPCGEGGWIHYRVLNREHLEDIKKLIRIKVNK